MFENLKVFEERYEALRGRLYDPSVVSDIKKYSEIQKELKTVEPVALKYREYKAAREQIEELREILTALLRAREEWRHANRRTN